jgi:enoyl-CoA hydratase
LIGQKKTNELLLTGDVIPARDAERIDMINRTVSVDELQTTIDKLAKKKSH